MSMNQEVIQNQIIINKKAETEDAKELEIRNTRNKMEIVKLQSIERNLLEITKMTAYDYK